MLTLSQKEAILRKAGMVVRPFPARRIPLQHRHDRTSINYPNEEREADIALEREVQEWKQGIAALYAAWQEKAGK
jgi:hypothetical protein